MSRITLAFGSFVVGACSTFFVSGSHTSTRAQGRIDGGPGGRLVVADSVPVVPKGVTILSGIEITLPEQQIDGFGCVRCTLKSPILIYGGGPFAFKDAKIAGPVRIVLTGAAANTVAFLTLVDGVNLVRPQEMPTPNSPIFKTASATEPITFSLESPYGQHSERSK